MLGMLPPSRMKRGVTFAGAGSCEDEGREGWSGSGLLARVLEVGREGLVGEGCGVRVFAVEGRRGGIVGAQTSVMARESVWKISFV